MSNSDPTWLHYKMQELEDWFPKQTLKKSGSSYRCQSIACPDLTSMRDLLYKDDRRTLCEKSLYPMKDIGFAVWFLDGGGWMGRDRKNLYLNVTKIEDSRFLYDYFNEIDLICSEVVTAKRKRLLFTTEASLRLVQIIGPCVPNFMAYRLRSTEV